MSRLKKLFENRNGKKVVSFYLTNGFPERECTSDLIIEMEKAGAELIELGMPFSDPLADGPTIQYASDVAIKNGVNLDSVFETVRQIRQKSQIPIVLMGYINPMLHYGMEDFLRQAGEVGADGLIIPDVPPEESDTLHSLAEKNGLDVIFLVAPNTQDERLRYIDGIASGFVYCVSVMGVTGARSGEEVADSVASFIGRVKKNITKNPVMIGFGIKSKEDATKIAQAADGFITGSALIETIRKNYPNSDWKDKTIEFVSGFRND